MLTPACTRQPAITSFSLFWHSLCCPVFWTFCIFIHTSYARNSSPQASVWFWGRKQPQLMKYSKCGHSAGLQNSIVFLMLFSSTVLWNLLCIGDAFLSKVCNLKDACLISLKILHRNFLPTATIKEETNSSHLFSPREKTDGGFVWKDFSFLSLLHKTSTEFFLNQKKGTAQQLHSC